MEYVGIIITKSVGIDFTIKCITTLTTSAQGIYSLVSSISSSSIYASDQDISKFLKELDIHSDISILEILIKEIDIHKHHTQTLSQCLEKLQECVINIENELIEINKRLLYNKSLWIAISMRSYGFQDIIENLKILKVNLKNRKKMLFDVIKINDYLISDEHR